MNKNRTLYRKGIKNLPEVKRFMNRVIESMGYNVSSLRTLSGKYYATLQAFELDVLDKSGFSSADKRKMLANGKIDAITEQKLDVFLKQKGIEIPPVLLEYGQSSADIAKEGAREYARADRSRMLAGKKPLIAQIARVSNTSEGLINKLVERRNYILDYEDDAQHFMGRKARDRRRERKADKRQYKLDKRRQRQDTRIARTQVKEDSKTDRTSITGDVEQSAGVGIAEGVGGAVSSVVGNLGGGFGSIFAGGGAIPDPMDDTRFSDLPTQTQASMFGLETEGLFKGKFGTKEAVALVGIGAVVYALYKMSTGS